MTALKIGGAARSKGVHWYVINGVHRIVLFCKDTDVSRAWYERAGFTYKHGHEGMHWFELGDGELMLHPDDSPSADGPSIHVIVDDLDDLFAKVKQAGLQPKNGTAPEDTVDGPFVQPWGEREFHLQDPDGQWWAFNEKD